MSEAYDALLIVSFGGPEGPGDVLPFLENVLRGRNVPRDRMLEVAEHYHLFGGVSPINQQIRALLAAVEEEFLRRSLPLSVYWGNRNWHPLLADTLRQMRDDGVRRSLAFFTSPYSSYSSCRQYRENIEAARQEAGNGAPQVEKLRAYFNHPGFIEPMSHRLDAALAEFPPAGEPFVLFTAHSIPRAMAETCAYQEQLEESSRLVAEKCNVSADRRRLVFQSRSGPPSQPWLEPDVGDVIKELHAAGTRDVCVVPIGFISDHVEVMFDLDVEARQIAERLGMGFVRAGTVGTDPLFVAMIADLALERIDPPAARPALGRLGPSHDVCPGECCVYTPRRS